MSTTMSAQPDAEKPTIKILLYTDDPQIAPSNKAGQFFGLGSMMERLQAHAPAFANIDIKWVSRNSDATHHADNKIDAVINKEVELTGKPFDEIWFFGMHQSNTDRFSLQARRGGPESELNEQEVIALTEWMKIRDDGSGGGGVLMTGDHSKETPTNLLATKNSRCADTSANATLLGLGRALGRCVPRAGSLRLWEGPPSYHQRDSFSTIFNNGLQIDPQPQQLDLPPVDANGDPDPNGHPHPLFFYKDGQFIRVFPDHTHEGAVVIPPEMAPLDPNVWPFGIRPRVVARGRDARRAQPLNIIATYNGDLAGVGRIVADSTWHHYMNLNLRGFPHPAPEGSASDQIGQFYANLAVWLAPLSKRRQMASAMLWDLTRFTLVLEEEADDESTGITARSVLGRVSSGCEIHELLRAYTRPRVAALYAENDGASDLPSTESALGSILKLYQEAVLGAPNTAFTADTLSVGNLVDAGFARAFERQAKKLSNTLNVLNSAVKPQ